ncbi:MAG: S41 family peptidase [Bacteroidia bacterium]
MIRLLCLLAGFSLLFPAFSQNSDELVFAHRPALSPDGSQIAFTHQGDIWTMPATGGQAVRLTIHEGYENYPTWSPDGKTIAFASSRSGSNDIYTIGKDGSNLTQLTYHSARDNMPAWAGNDSIFFVTTRSYVQVEWMAEIHSVSANGGTPHRRLDALGSMPAVSPNGRYVAFVRGDCRIEREAYRGPANRDIWVYDTKNNRYEAITEDIGQDVYPKWGDDNTLYFLSAQNGRYNIHRARLDNGKLSGKAEAISDFKKEGLRYFDVSANGNTVVMWHGTEMKTSSLSSFSPKTVTFSVNGDYRFDPETRMTLSSGVTDFALSPNEKQIALVARGEVFVTKNDNEDSRTTNLSNHNYHDKDPVWLDDSTLFFLSDRDGSFDIYMLRSVEENTPDLFKSLRHEAVRVTNTDEDEATLLFSPDKTKLAYRKGTGTLIVVDVDTMGKFGESRTLTEGWARPSGVSWSPDSKWLAYSMDDLDFNEEIYIQPVDGSREPTNISLHPRGDVNPVWSKDGSKLGFISNRNNGDNDVWFVWLKKEDWEKTKAEWIDLEKDGEPESGKKDADSDEPAAIQIDFEDIYMRLEQVTRLAGDESNVKISHDGETFFFITNGGGRRGSGGDPSLMRVKWDGSEMKPVLGSASRTGGLALDKAGTNLYMRKNRGIAKVSVEGGSPKSLPFSGRMTVNHAEEHAQIFEEAWRALEDQFYDPNFHGQNWEALRKQYRPRALASRTDEDFRGQINQMLGQLNASHMGIFGGSRAETKRTVTGRLGIEVKADRRGLRVTRIVPGTPASRKESKLNVGDVITAVNQMSVQDHNLYKLLDGTVGQRTLLALRGSDGEEREVVIRPVRSIKEALYESWIKERKRMTEKYSKGRLGYIHVEAMGWSSFERFERELTAAGLGKDGILIDVRYNGGGWTTDMLMTVLNVRQHSYTIPRGATPDLEKDNAKYKKHYPYGERLPLSAWTKPSAALCNEYSYSNAEIFSHAFKTLGHGPLIGMPTFGAVISTGGKSLMNGHFVRMPFRAWYVLATGENMENGPAVPTHIVPYPPKAKSSGDDPQLQKAVEVLLEGMK